MKRLLLLSVLFLGACSQQAAGEPLVIRWTAQQTGVGEAEAPQMKLSLLNDKTQKSLYDTECAGTVSVDAVTDAEGNLTSMRCWWAGGGDDYAVFETENALSVRHRTVDEEAGYGEWEEVAVIR